MGAFGAGALGLGGSGRNSQANTLY
jgi:hypothetical protein